MWLKILICIAVIAFFTGLGYLISGKYRARKKFYTQFCAFNERYLNELTFTRKPLSSFLKEFEYTGDFGKTIEAAEKREGEIKYSYLKKKEKKTVADYFQMLGKGDSASQKNFFAAQKAKLEEKRTDSEKQAKARSELYLKLGLLLGLAIVILIL